MTITHDQEELFRKDMIERSAKDLSIATASTDKPDIKEWRPELVDLNTKKGIQELLGNLGIDVTGVFILGNDSYHVRGYHKQRPFILYCNKDWMEDTLVKLYGTPIENKINDDSE